MSKRILLTSFVALGLVGATMAVAESDTYTINYIAGQGGVGADQTQSVTYGDTFTTKPANTFNKPNATFAGWQSIEVSSPWTEPNTTYTYDMSRSVTLEAQWTCSNGWHTKPGMSGSDLQTEVGTSAAENRAYINGNGVFSQQNFGGSDHNQDFYGITANNAWAVYYGMGHGLVTGQARCSAQSGVGVWDGVNSASDITKHTSVELGAEGSVNCYCKTTGYRSDGGEMQTLYSPWWIFSSSHSDATDCISYCAYRCANDMRDTSSNCLLLRSALLGNSSVPASCEGNTITVSWSGVGSNQASDGTTMSDYSEVNHTGNTSVTYGENVVVPKTPWAPSGKIFKGWRFFAPSQQ